MWKVRAVLPLRAGIPDVQKDGNSARPKEVRTRPTRPPSPATKGHRLEHAIKLGRREFARHPVEGRSTQGAKRPIGAVIQIRKNSMQKEKVHLKDTVFERKIFH